MFGMLLGAGLNIVLDPVFIFGLDMGVRGAAVATVLAQLVSTVFLLRYFLAGKGSVAFKPGFPVPDSAISKEVVAIGIGPFIVEASNSVMMIFVNNALCNLRRRRLNCSLRDHPPPAPANLPADARDFLRPPAHSGL